MAIIFKYPAAIACRVAGIEKQRFNEAVAHNRYRCAPRVLKGGIRTFIEDDVVALFIFARLVEKRYPPSIAGEIACSVRKRLQEAPEAKSVSIPLVNERSAYPSPEQLRNPIKDSEEYSALVEITFDIDGIRSSIKPALAAELSGNKSSEKRKQNMGAPVFTEAELRRTMKIAAEFSATVKISPRDGVIRLVMPKAKPNPMDIEGKNQCDEAFGL